jgi:hypothetical protein
MECGRHEKATQQYLIFVFREYVRLEYRAHALARMKFVCFSELVRFYRGLPRVAPVVLRVYMVV